MLVNTYIQVGPRGRRRNLVVASSQENKAREGESYVAKAVEQRRKKGTCSGPHFFLSEVPPGPTLRGHKRQPRHGDRLSDTLTQPLNHRLRRASLLPIHFSRFSFFFGRDHPLPSFRFRSATSLLDSISLLSADLAVGSLLFCTAKSPKCIKVCYVVRQWDHEIFLFSGSRKVERS